MGAGLVVFTSSLLLLKMDIKLVPERVSDLRKSRGSSSMAPGWVRVILSNRKARALEEGAESRSARARSSSLLFCRVKKTNLLLYFTLITEKIYIYNFKAFLHKHFEFIRMCDP